MKDYKVFYTATLNGVCRKGCLTMHGCYSKLDAGIQARKVLGKNINIIDVVRSDKHGNK